MAGSRFAILIQCLSVLFKKKRKGEEAKSRGSTVMRIMHD